MCERSAPSGKDSWLAAMHHSLVSRRALEGDDEGRINVLQVAAVGTHLYLSLIHI